MAELLSSKTYYSQPIQSGEPVPLDIVKDCYSVFACRHKFCREVCPVYQLTGDEANTSYGFHSALLGISQGVGGLAELSGTIMSCLECGACELRCPTTLYGGDFYRSTTTTVDLVRKLRRDMVADGTPFDGYEQVSAAVERHLGYFEGPESELTRWADGLDLPHSGETIMFVDYFDAFETTEVPRLAARILQAAGVEFGILPRPAATLGELLDVDLERFVEQAQHNVEALKEAGARRVIMLSPHEYSYFVRDYPAHLGELPFEVVFITDELERLWREGRLTFEHEVDLRVSYHDPCTLNKMCGVTSSPRELLAALPGVEFVDVDPVTQWSYCCGKGNASFKAAKPEASYQIGMKRLRDARDLGVQHLVVGCPHCKDQLTDVNVRGGAGVEAVHILEPIAQAMGLMTATGARHG
jgi:heterodisulfide reductase subunit D